MKLIKEIETNYQIMNPKDAYNYFKEFEDQDREMLVVVGLDTKNRPCYREIVSIGTLNYSVIHPREVFKKAIMMSCNSIIVAHNHPSGDNIPSEEDYKINRCIKQSSEILNIKLLDNLIITKNEYRSIIND